MNENSSSKTTTYLIEKSNGLLKLQDEPNDWTTGNFKCFNFGSVEMEVGEFLYAMVRLTKANNILDLGSHYGVSAMYMAQACKDNGAGKVISIEQDNNYLQKAQELWRATEVNDYIIAIRGSSLTDIPKQEYDLILSDTEPEIRFKEIVKVFPQLKVGGYIFVHDLPRGFCVGNINLDHSEIKNWPWGEVPKEIDNWLADGELMKWHFETPRSFVGFYKARPDDYKLWT